MNKGMLVCVAAMLAWGTAKAGVVVVMDSRVPGNVGTQEMQISVSGKDLRMDYGDEDSLIYRGSDGVMVTLDHTRRTFVVLDKQTVNAMAAQMAPVMQQLKEQLAQLPPEQAAMMEKMMKEKMAAMSPPAAADIKVQQTGKDESINDYDCEWWDVLSDNTRSGAICMTDTGNVEGGAEFVAAMHGMVGFHTEVMSAFRDAGLPGVPTNPFAEMQKMHGFPVVTRQYDGLTVTSESQVRSATSQDVDTAIFEPPAGYTRQQMKP